MIITDQLNRVLDLKQTPKRIISLVPCQTELFCDLGLQDSLVGVTKFCVHPAEIRKNKTIVGGTKTIHLNKIKSLQPDIILCNKEENTKNIVKSCEEICPVHVSDIYTIEDSLQLIKQYGKIFNRMHDAELICNSIQKEQHDFRIFIIGKLKLKVVYFIWMHPWMVAAKDTFINHLLGINKLENVFQHLERYPIIDIDKENLQKEIDLIMLPSEPYPFKKKHIAGLQNYFPSVKIILVDGEMFSWYGSRLIKAFQYFKTLH